MKRQMIFYSMLAVIFSTAFFSCSNEAKKTESNTVAPSAGDEARYNLSPQQEMTLQTDTTKTDSTRTDSIQ